MKVIVLVKKGAASTAFKMREVPKPIAKPGEVLIKVAAFGLNFADVMARKGLYKEAPPLPCILGYDVAGIIDAVGEGVLNLKIGDRVTAMTRFGGYAEYAVTNAQAVAIIPDSLPLTTATALATQYCTAVYAAAELVNLYPGDKVLVQAGAGGVGLALIQFAKYKQCEIFATAGSQAKVDYLRQQGVQHAINYNTENFAGIIKNDTQQKGIDVIFDAVGGKGFRQGMGLLAAGGRMVCYGAAQLTGKNIFGIIKTVLAFGFYHPAQLMMPSKSIIGINLLSIGDQHPQVIERCLAKVITLYKEGVFLPAISKVFAATDIAAAHDYLEKRKNIGKVVIEW